ncbi:hypothetical protein [Candidatus Lokiarchaeum ossiferum]|uniref:hypothetical protein n=1 Tax=Candidatus Lokiarchaeum ossiferum TaxID=2951803 RepID=UPI00352D30AD
MRNLFPKDIDCEIVKIKQQKSNLIMSLRDISDIEKQCLYKKIIPLELQIADMEIIRGFYDKAISNIKNGLIFLEKLGNSENFMEKIYLRGLIEEKFPENSRNHFYELLIGCKPIEEEDAQQISTSLRNFYAFVIDEFTQKKLKANIQNINKAHFYLFQNTPFMHINAIVKPEIKVGSFPLHSIKFERFFSNYSENWDIFHKENNLIQPRLEYDKFKIFARNLRNKMLKISPHLIEYYEELLYDFSEWDSTRIKEWEEKTTILVHFKRGDTI